MATQTLELVVENGMFRPVEGALPFSEGQHVKAIVETEENNQEAQPKPMILELHAGLAGLVGWHPTFDDELPDSFLLGKEKE
ncbi:MAG TPA: hypothetical protein VGB45_11240 [Abditibacterium sp.]|jgi:hypothetical protein